MKVIEANAGLLTNFEVLDLLRSRGAHDDPLASIGSVTPSEYKVYDYLKQTAAGTQTRESLQNFFKELDKYSLTKAERLQVANIRPSSAVETHLIVEDCEERMSSEVVEQFIENVESSLAPPPEQFEVDGGNQGEDMKGEEDAEEQSE